MKSFVKVKPEVYLLDRIRKIIELDLGNKELKRILKDRDIKNNGTVLQRVFQEELEIVLI